MKQVLGNRALVILGIAEAISHVGSWVTIMALYALLIFDGGGGVLESSGLMLAGLAPTLLIGPVAGWLADRFDRKKLMIGAELLAALPILALLWWGEGLWIFLLLALQSSFGAIMMPARQASVPQLVGREQLTQANAFLQQLGSFVKIGAPILGSAIVGLLGAHVALLIDVISYGLAAGLLCLLPALLPPPQGNMAQDAAEQGQEKSQKDTSAQEGLVVVLGSRPRLRLLFVMTFLAILVIMGFDTLSAIVIRDVLAADERFFGFVIALVGIGSVVGGVWLMVRKQQVDPWHDLLTGLLLLTALPAVMSLGYALGDPAQARVLLCVGAFMGGLGSSFTTIQIGTLLQLLSPQEMLGRLSGVFQSTIAAAQIITILVTPLLVPALLSIGSFFGLSTVALLLVIGWTLLTLRRHPEQAVVAPVLAPQIEMEGAL